MLVDDLDLFDLIAPFAFAVLAELCCKDGQANLRFLDISASNLDENIAGIESDLGLLRIDDGWQRQNLPVLVVEDRVPVERLQDWKELLHLDIVPEDIEKRVGVHGFALFQRLEDNLAGWVRFVGDWALDFVQVVRAHRCQGTTAADVLVKFVLQVNERIV